VAGARAGHVLGQKNERHRLGQVQIQIGAGPLEGIVRQRSGLAQFGQPVPDGVEMGAASSAARASPARIASTMPRSA
jgi:hypothetical protein